MTSIEQQTFRFTSHKSRRIRGAFDGGEISSDGGLMLVREADRRLGLTNAVAGVVEDKRQGGKVLHDVGTMLRQRVYGMCSGDEDLNDFEQLRHDPLWQAACDVDAPFAGKSTLCRFENGADHKLAVNVHKILVDKFIASFDEPPKEIILDFDATDNPVHGLQEGRFFHGYYDRYCFLPLYVFCGDQLLVAYLRKSDRDASRNAGAILKLLVKRIREDWPDVKIIFRADGGFCRNRILYWCENNNVDYIVGLSKNSALLAKAHPFLEQAEKAFEETGVRQKVFGGIIYGAKTWARQRHVICKAEHNEQGANPRFVVTSLKGSDQELYEKVYCHRGEMENRIKEQMMLFSGRTSAHRWWANQWRLLLSALAYTLFEAIRRIGLKGTKLAKTQCHWLRLKLIKIGTLIQRTKSRIVLQMASGYPHKQVFIDCLKRLRPT